MIKKMNQFNIAVFEKPGRVLLVVTLLAFISYGIRHTTWPALPENSLSAFQRFCAADHNNLPSHNQEYDVFKPYLPSHGSVSFIMDYPFHPYSKTVGQLYTAQSRLAPLVLNPSPDEKNAIIFCTDAKTADIRMLQTGYRLTQALANGKGVAVKL